MESASIAQYARVMGHELAELLGGALRELRKRTTRTQDAWADRTGMSQSYISAAERGESGWDSVINIASAIEKAGADPIDLLRIAVAQAEQDEGQRELMGLWAAADETTRTAILMLLRSQVTARAASR